jgi:predicted TIM-barrel fold metal-dependent hydrolase
MREENAMTTNLEKIVDGDGHINEDLEAIAEYLPAKFRDHPARALNASLFPALDHLHSGHFVETPGRRDRGAAFVGPAEWEVFLQEVRIDATVLYPTKGLGFGKIVSRDWSIAVAQAYNDWLYSTYLSRSDRFKGMALVPMQEPEAAVEELRRAVEDLGFVGAMLPSFGLPDHLGSKTYWGVYEEANRLGCAIAVHGGAHSGIGLDHMNVYAPVHALGHPLGQAYALAGMTFNGVFERFPKMRVGFMEGGIAWFLMCWERFNASHATHMEYQLRDDDMLGPKIGERVTDYLQRQIDADRIFIGCEGDEPSLAYAIGALGNKPFLYSSDFPHEVTRDSCIEELNELQENKELTNADKEAILHKNAQRFYGI